MSHILFSSLHKLDQKVEIHQGATCNQTTRRLKQVSSPFETVMLISHQETVVRRLKTKMVLVAG